MTSYRAGRVGSCPQQARRTFLQPDEGVDSGEAGRPSAGLCRGGAGGGSISALLSLFSFKITPTKSSTTLDLGMEGGP